MWAVKHYPERREFSWMDLPAMAAACGMAPPTPPAAAAAAPSSTLQPAPPAHTAPAHHLFVEAIMPHPERPAPRAAPLPLTKQAASLADTYVMPLTHLVYGGTWYTLAACGVAITYSKFFRRRGGGGGAGGRSSRAAASAAAAVMIAAGGGGAPPR